MLCAALVSLAGSAAAAPEDASCTRDSTEICPEPVLRAALSSSEERTLSLRDALRLAAEWHPSLEWHSLELQAQDAGILQAGLRPNPEVVFEVENVGTSGLDDAFSDTETTVALRLPLELGGKRARRTSLARTSRSLAEWDMEAQRLEVLAETAVAFTHVLAAQEQLELARESIVISRAQRDSIRDRAARGAASAVEQRQSEVALATSELEVRLVARRLAGARNALAAMWGSRAADFSRVTGSFWELRPPPSWDDLEESAQSIPELRRWEDELAQRRAALALARAERVPDMELQAGYRRLSETNDNAFVFEMSTPLALFDRNQGVIEQSRLAVQQARSERAISRLQVEKTLAGSYEALSRAYLESQSLEMEIIPLARASFETAEKGYRIGRYRYTDVIDAQRELFELRTRQIEALASYHLAETELARFLGTLNVPATQTRPPVGRGSGVPSLPESREGTP